MEQSLLAIFGLGLLYGIQHATDADHLVAVSTIVSEHKSFKWASFIGAFWGLGHTTTLFLVGLAAIGRRRENSPSQPRPQSGNPQPLSRSRQPWSRPQPRPPFQVDAQTVHRRHGPRARWQRRLDAVGADDDPFRCGGGRSHFG